VGHVKKLESKLQEFSSQFEKLEQEHEQKKKNASANLSKAQDQIKELTEERNYLKDKNYLLTNQMKCFQENSEHPEDK